MATPAASAWHRRRHLLATPAQKISNVRDSSSLRRDSISSLNSSDRGALRSGLFVRGQQPSTKLQNASAAEDSRPRSVYLNDAVRLLAQPFHSNFKASILHTLVAASAAVALAYMIAQCVVFPAITLLAITQNGAYRAVGHQFPIVVFILKIIAFALSNFAVFVMYFLLSKAIGKRLRVWGVQHASRPCSESRFLRLRILYAVACASGCVLQAVVVAYITYGPILAPLPSSSELGQELGRQSTHLLPSWSNLSLCSLCALFSGVLHATLWIESKVVSYVHPFYLPIAKRVMFYLPKTLLLSGLPVVGSLVPAVAVHLLLCLCSGQVIGQGFWFSSIQFVGLLLSSSSCSFASILSWNLLAMLEDHFLIQQSVLTPTQQGFRAQAADATWERSKILLLAQQYDDGRSLDENGCDMVWDGLNSLSALCRAQEGLSEFPGFTDASGSVWRFSVLLCLIPIDRLQELLRAQNVLHLQSTSGGTEKGTVLLEPSRASPVLHSVRGPKVNVIFPNADLCIKCCEVLARLVTASYELDSFGVVHRTLPHLIHSLLRCKEETETLLTRHKLSTESDVDARANRHGAIWASVQWWRQAMMLRSTDGTIAAIDDALALALYRISGVFRNHMYSYVEGMEVTWDRSLDRNLRMFLDYQVS